MGIHRCKSKVADNYHKIRVQYARNGNIFSGLLDGYSASCLSYLFRYSTTCDTLEFKSRERRSLSVCLVITNPLHLATEGLYRLHQSVWWGASSPPASFSCITKVAWLLHSMMSYSRRLSKEPQLRSPLLYSRLLTDQSFSLLRMSIHPRALLVSILGILGWYPTYL